jgi:hypothetical protein
MHLSSLVQDVNRRRAVVDTVINLRIPRHVGRFLSS